jgi:enamine deaminase RidA (YjgF/YER057c/UK114 family)
MAIVEDPAEQARQAFRNIEKALAEAGGTLADVVRVRYYVPDIADWPRIVSYRCWAKSSVQSARPPRRSFAA